MHLRLFAIVISLVCEVIRMGSGVAQRQSAHRETSEDCRSCLECSSDNGCVRCPERLFLFLQREGMSHHGTCLHACPAGHYGQRGKDINRCMKDCLLAPPGEWSKWSTCLHDGLTCGFRWGKQTRTRVGGESSRTPEEKTATLCPSHSETQRCRMKKKCSTERKKNNQQGPGKKKERKLQQLGASNSTGSSQNGTADAAAEHEDPRGRDARLGSSPSQRT
ncbi:R-spondin-4 isoform X2 [Channa argus]|uniref:R-spondin-4 isoform X2 n=1 Tax=Channa argus TaxID=215402 RepID=UPI0035217321